jgi:hypothetical protein
MEAALHTARASVTVPCYHFRDRSSVVYNFDAIGSELTNFEALVKEALLSTNLLLLPHTVPCCSAALSMNLR